MGFPSLCDVAVGAPARPAPYRAPCQAACPTPVRGTSGEGQRRPSPPRTVSSLTAGLGRRQHQAGWDSFGISRLPRLGFRSHETQTCLAISNLQNQQTDPRTVPVSHVAVKSDDSDFLPIPFCTPSERVLKGKGGEERDMG